MEISQNLHMMMKEFKYHNLFKKLNEEQRLILMILCIENNYTMIY
jgi:hypothetical protein